MKYKPHPHHRNGTPGKSQWTIPVPQEAACFDYAVNHSWIFSSAYWGLHLAGQAAQDLGDEHRGRQVLPVRTAKFVEDQNVWHGYPVAHWLSPHDKPADVILKSWQVAGHITKATRRRIGKGTKCKL